MEYARDPAILAAARRFLTNQGFDPDLCQVHDVYRRTAVEILQGAYVWSPEACVAVVNVLAEG